jgi:CRP/FNR family transcriptional regulator, cyclic AMP receptor protein
LKSLADVLGQVWIFEGLVHDELYELAALARTRVYKPRETIVEKGDAARQLYVLLRGRAKVATRGADGSDTGLNVMGPGEVFGEIGILDGQPRSATVTTLEECEMAVLDMDAFRTFLAGHPSIGIKLLAVLARRVRDLTTRLEDRTFLEVPARLAKQLLWLAEHHGAPSGSGVQIELRLSQQELGDLIGATRESVNKYLSEWTRNKLLRQARDRVEIFDLQALRAIAAES